MGNVIEDNKLDMIKEYARKYWVYAVIVAIGIGSLSFSQLVVRNRTSKLDAVHNKLSAVQNNIATQESALKMGQTTSVSNSSGLSQERVDKDMKIIDSFFKKVATWDSYDSYMQIRNDLKTEYGLKDDNSFLRVFMPEVTSQVDATGKVYSQICPVGQMKGQACDSNEKLNILFSDLRTHVVAITPEYHYVIELDVTSASGNKGSSKQRVVFETTIDVDGKLGDIKSSIIVE